VKTVVDAINRAGGIGQQTSTTPGGSSPSAVASQMQVVLRRNVQTILQLQYAELLAGRDVPVQKGDEIIVRPNSRFFTVLGAVQRSGNVELLKSNLTLLEALGTVGGLQDQQANKTGVFLFRMGDLDANPAARARVFRLDFNQPVSIFVAQRFYMQPRDVVYVSNAPLYEYNKILTSIYQSIAIIGVARGNIIPTTVF
jgi:polysaccharide export outer membrane protein